MNVTTEMLSACVRVLLVGGTLKSGDVTAGNDKVIDWRTVRCGEEMEAGDAFDTAMLFCTLMGEEKVADALAQIDPALAPPPEVSAYALQACGGRARSFTVGGFRVLVEADEDDQRQAEFCARLASLAREALR